MPYIRNMYEIWCFILFFYNFIKKMDKRQGEDDTVLRKNIDAAL